MCPSTQVTCVQGVGEDIVGRHNAHSVAAGSTKLGPFPLFKRVNIWVCNIIVDYFGTYVLGTSIPKLNGPSDLLLLVMSTRPQPSKVVKRRFHVLVFEDTCVCVE